MASTDSAMRRARQPSAPADGLGRHAAVPHVGRRDRIRSKPGLAQAYRIGVFAAGLLFIVLGAALVVLPGPLTIPPVLLGLWIWSTEFRFADRLLESFRRRAREAWTHARRHPRSSAAVTIGGLVAAAAAIWAIAHFELTGAVQQAVGL